MDNVCNLKSFVQCGCFRIKICFIFLLFKRNEVWRYDQQFGHVPGRKLFLRYGTTGMGVGLLLAIATVVLKTGYNKIYGNADAHHHH